MGLLRRNFELEKVLRLIGSILLTIFLIGCEDKSLASRKSHCDSYIRQQLIGNAELATCMSDKNFYSRVAVRYSTEHVDMIYPTILRSKQLLDKQFLSLDQNGYSHLDDSVELPLGLDDANKTKNWRYFFTLRHAWFSAPSLEDEQLEWSVAGDRGSEESFYTFPLDGVAPDLLRGLENVCPSVSLSTDDWSCNIEVYIDVVNEGEFFSHLAIFGVKFLPPNKEVILASVLETEMRGFDLLKEP
jgi:hypothetical protein